MFREPYAKVKLLEGLERRPSSCCHHVQQIDTFGGRRRGARGPAGAAFVNRRGDASGFRHNLHHVGKALRAQRGVKCANSAGKSDSRAPRGNDLVGVTPLLYEGDVHQTTPNLR